jgi:starch synthase
MGAGPVRLISARTPDSSLPVWFVDCPRFFRRPGGLYQDQHGQDWPDNLERFALFSQITARFSRGELLKGFRADVLHANDWHSGLATAILGATEGHKPHTVFTLHNFGYQGVFPSSDHCRLGPLPATLDRSGLEFYGQISLLKAGINSSDVLTTVSPTYAKEILTPEYGNGLDGLLRHRSDRLIGILNGADYRIWDPSSDALSPAGFTVRNGSGKRLCKATLQAEFGLDPDPDVPLVAFMSRLNDQKMADIVADTLPEMASRGAQCVIFGGGDRAISEKFNRQAHHYPGLLSARTGYEEKLAHLVLTGSDMLLIPRASNRAG